jgi:hypothetical protein
MRIVEFGEYTVLTALRALEALAAHYNSVSLEGRELIAWPGVLTERRFALIMERPSLIDQDEGVTTLLAELREHNPELDLYRDLTGCWNGTLHMALRQAFEEHGASCGSRKCNDWQKLPDVSLRAMRCVLCYLCFVFVCVCVCACVCSFDSCACLCVWAFTYPLALLTHTVSQNDFQEDG